MGGFTSPFVHDILLDFYAYFIQEDIQSAKQDWNSELTDQDYQTYYSQAQDKVPYDLFHNIEEFLYQFTGNPLPDITVTSQLKDQSSTEVLTQYKEFVDHRAEEYCKLIKDMYNSCTGSHTRKDMVTKDNFTTLMDVLCNYLEDDCK